MARDKEKIKINKRRYYLENRESILEKVKNRQRKLREELIDYLKEYRVKNKELIKQKKRENYLLFTDKIKQNVSDYYQQNKKVCNERKLKRNKIRRELDIGFRIKSNLRGRISHLLKQTKSKSSLKLLGCSVEFLKEHLESKFTKGMNWNNYGKGGWVVDHIIPCVSFDLSKPSEQRKCFNYKNLQPLWEIDNLYKHAKILTI